MKFVWITLATCILSLIALACSDTDSAAPVDPGDVSPIGDAGTDGDAAGPDADRAVDSTEETGPTTEVLVAACTPVAFGDAASGAVCGYYNCVDDVLGCSDDAYLVAFACKYADRYLAQTYGEMTADGRRFLEEVFECLQETLDEENGALDCTTVEEIGFASHVPCYVEAGFCDLILDDKLLVLQAIDPEDLEHPLQILAQSEIIERCSE